MVIRQVRSRSLKLERTMTADTVIHYEQILPEYYKMFEKVEIMLANEDFDVQLRHLVKLRASQINGCAFCVDMHTKEARRDGETNERLDRLVVWRHVEDYSEAEKAALAWTECLTVISDATDYGTARAALRSHYTDKQISVLTYIIVMINNWNRLQVSKH